MTGSTTYNGSTLLYLSTVRLKHPLASNMVDLSGCGGNQTTNVEIIDSKDKAFGSRWLC